MMPKGHAPTSIDRLLTTEEVAYQLGIPVAKAKYLIQRRRIPVVKMGRWNRVRQSELTAYIASLPHTDGKGATRE